GGFLKFAETLTEKVRKMGGVVLFNTEISEIKSNGRVEVKTNRQTHTFDKVIVTLPSFFFFKIAPSLPESYKNKYSNLKGLGAINLVLRLRKQFLGDGSYWLSICDTSSPIMAIVDHSNFMDVKNYSNEHLVYLGNYLPADHKYFKMDKSEILKIYDPFLRRLNKDYAKELIDYEAFKVPFAQPIIPINYSKMIPPFVTPLPNVYLANIQQVYPWDRGTNYAVELGAKIADLISNDQI
ncbi:MAG: hypothetical protein ACD_37C00661G0001, partial [uncultured bacterium]